jgi:4-alpha-glucanotransferase
MSPIHLILGSHNSQAVNLAQSDQDALYEYSYKPLLKLLYNHGHVRFTMYYSGLLIEWLEKHHTEFVDVLTEMVKRRQVELLGGAFFEPILPLIPKTDRIGQIERLTTHIRKCFGRRPRGAWIPESVWDQRIAANLKAGGIEYAFLRDNAFYFGADGVSKNGESGTGVSGSDGSPGQVGHQPVLTEDQGKTLLLLPLDYDLSQRIFVSSPEEIIDELSKIASDERNDDRSPRQTPLVSLIFDGNAIGYDPDISRERVQWFERFLSLLAENADWIKVGTPQRVLRSYQPRSRRYAPVSSLYGLMAWLRREFPELPVDQNDRWRSFRSIMEIYPESGRLYAKMQHTHVLVNQVRGDKYRKMTAREELWRGQSHFAYWLNSTGGIYRSGLRKSTYGALIEAEKTTRERGIFIPSLSRVDVDLDGEDEILYQGNELNVYVDRSGASVFELDYLDRNWNYLDTFRRRPEPFHDEASVAAGYDDWQRSAFVDHFLVPGHSMESFAKGERRQVCRLDSMDYELANLDKEHNTAVFETTCVTPDSLGEIFIRKTYRFIKNRIELEYRLSNSGMEPVRFDHACETNLSFYSLEAGKLRLHLRQGRQRQEISPDRYSAEAVSDIQFYDLHNGTTITVNPSDRPGLWSFPVEAVGVLWDRPHWFYQSNCIVLIWPVNLGAGESQTVSVSLKIESTK